MDTFAWAVAALVVAVLVIAAVLSRPKEQFLTECRTPTYVRYTAPPATTMTDSGSVHPYDDRIRYGGASDRILDELSAEALGDSRGFRSLAPRDPSSGAAGWSVIRRAPDGKRVAGSRRRSGWTGATLGTALPCAG